MRGIFITFEGIEGAGKSTQIERLKNRLESRGRDVVCVREPGGTVLGEKIRGILQADDGEEPLSAQTELLLFESSRSHLMSNVIIPALEAGKCVICDRFTDSTTAYQGYGRMLDVEEVIRINDFAAGGLQPDLTILLALGTADGMARIESRNSETGSKKDRIERENGEFHARVADGYGKLAERYPERFKLIDASGALDEIAESVWKEVEPLVH